MKTREKRTLWVQRNFLSCSLSGVRGPLLGTGLEDIETQPALITLDNPNAMCPNYLWTTLTNSPHAHNQEVAS